jgi:hypothetical protein
MITNTSPIRIYQVGNLLECEKADSQWQDHFFKVPASLKSFVDRRSKKIEIFEIG